MAVRQALVEVGGVEIVAECANGFEAVKAVAEVAAGRRCCSTSRCRSSTASRCWSWSAAAVPVVFVTAYDEFALRAFEVHAVDYLLKPFTAERLAGGAGPRAASGRRRRARRRRRCAAAARPPGRRSTGRDSRRRAGARVAGRKIDYVEAQDDYVAFHTAGQDDAQGADARRPGGAARPRGGSSGSIGRTC